MKYIKKIANYILIFIVTVAILTLLLFAVSKIPGKYIEENIKESLPYFEKYRFQIDEQTKRRDYTIINPYADSMILNIIYALDTDNALSSVMEAKYYSEFGEDDYDNRDLNKMVKNNLEPNEEYMRYWHGSIIIIKPLLMFLNLEQMHHLNFYILLIMEAIVLTMLLKRKQFELCIAYVLGLLATSFWIVPRSLEYTWCYMLMNIISAIAIIFKDDNKKLNKLFFISGILVCYFDFFTAETLTILVPILMVIGIRYKENKEGFNFKENILFIIKSLFTWGLAYAFMWAAKWLLASIILGKSSLPHVLGKAKRRVNGDLYNKTRNDMYSGAILRNLYTLYPINIIKNPKEFILPTITYLLIQLLIIDYKNKSKIKFLFTMLFIGIIPYIRYLVLANHSYLHCFFTFRAQFATVMALTLILLFTTSKEKLFKQVIKINKNNEEEKKQENKIEINKSQDMELTILMPVLNEEETIESCIKKAKTYLEKNNINGEVLISDNGSTDNSVQLAKNLGARVVLTEEKGYGNALINGIIQARGKYIIMADADDSYDLLNLDTFYEKLKEGYDLVMGNRYKGGIEKGAMKLSHKIGVKFLSLVGRIVCKCNVYDFHCGIRGLNTESIKKLKLKETGMEFASEMIVEASKQDLKMCEIPTTLSKDGRIKGKSHLNTIKDGFRHLNYLLKAWK